MKLSIREMNLKDIEKVVDYFVDADDKYLSGMGADKNKLPERESWISKLRIEVKKEYVQKEFYYIIWLLDNQPVGHSNVNKIQFGKSATMHLHLWKNKNRQSGLGLDFLKRTIPFYFEKLGLLKLICEPYSKNIAANKTLNKLGFDLIRTYKTTPGWINFHQTVNRHELTRTKFESLNTTCNKM